MTVEQNKCLVCDKPLHPYPMGTRDAFQFVGCKICGSVFTEPAVTPQSLEKFFGDIQPEVVHLPNPDLEIGNVQKSLLKLGVDLNGKTFLDVCARQGYAVIAAKQLGMRASGIDSHDFFATFAKAKYGEALFSHTTLPEYAASGKKADVVYLYEAFCEQTDLDGFTAALARVLNVGGIAYIDEVDGNSFNVPKNFPSWDFVDPPLNFFYLSKKGMEALLARHGLKIRKSFFCWSPRQRLIVEKV